MWTGPKSTSCFSTRTTRSRYWVMTRRRCWIRPGRSSAKRTKNSFAASVSSSKRYTRATRTAWFCRGVSRGSSSSPWSATQIVSTPSSQLRPVSYSRLRMTAPLGSGITKQGFVRLYSSLRIPFLVHCSPLNTTCSSQPPGTRWSGAWTSIKTK